MSLTMEARRAQLDSQIAEPAVTADMTHAERRAEMDRWLADCQAQSTRLDEESLALGLGWSASVSLTHEITGSWDTATASRWFLALPERYMTPDDLSYPDWDHSHYTHDEYGRIGRVATRQRPETDEDRRAAAAVRAALGTSSKETGQ
jgi:hypothetical protein